MAKLQKREMIILGVMAIAILYAAFEFLAPKKESAGRNVVQKTAELNTFVTGLTAGLGKDTTKGLNALVFSRAEKEWTQDPFLDTKSLRALSKSRELAKVAPCGRRRRSSSSTPGTSKRTGNGWPSSTAWNTGKARSWISRDTF